MSSALVSCPEPIKSRQYPSPDDIYYLTFRNVGHIGGFQFDLYFQLPILANAFFLVNDTVPTNTKYIHFKPMNRGNPSGSAGYTPDGSEQWFAMNALSFSIGGPVGGPNYNTFIRFKNPVNYLYLSTGTESGGGGNITIACVANDALIVSGGAWT